MDDQVDNPFLTESGDQAFDCMYNIRLSNIRQMTGRQYDVEVISKEQIYRDCLNALVGVPSTTFVFNTVSYYI